MFPLRARFFSLFLKTVTASQKYPGGPGWEGASAAFAWRGSLARSAGVEDRGAEAGTEREKREKGRSTGVGQWANGPETPESAERADRPSPGAGGRAAGSARSLGAPAEHGGRGQGRRI